MQLSPHARFVTIVAKDYFLSGDQVGLSRHAAAHLPAKLSGNGREFFDMVLGNQLVVHRRTDGFTSTHLCKVGSGMGLTGSGEVSDCCLLELCERKCVLDLAFRARHGVRQVFRYKHDILDLVDGPREPWKK